MPVIPNSDYITIDFHEISISNTSPYAASMQQSGNTKDLGIMGSYKNDVPLGHTTLADDSDTSKSPTKTYSQGPSKLPLRLRKWLLNYRKRSVGQVLPALLAVSWRT